MPVVLIASGVGDLDFVVLLLDELLNVFPCDLVILILLLILIFRAKRQNQSVFLIEVLRHEYYSSLFISLNCLDLFIILPSRSILLVLRILALLSIFGLRLGISLFSFLNLWR